MIRRVTLIAAALLIAAPTTSRAGIERAGTTAANFLQVGTGAGMLGMGGATLGLANGDLGAITWNPATLAQVGESQIAFSHVGLAQQSAQEWAAVAGRFRTLPFRWAFSGLYQGDGSFDGRDALGNPTGTFNASSMAFGLNGAYTVMEKVNVGLGVKYVSETLGDVRGSGIAFDLGVHATHGRYGFGAALQNTGGKMNYDGSTYPFGANMGVGVSITDPGTGLRAALDFNIPNAYYPDVRAGVEWRYQDRLALRTGYRHELGAESNEPMSGPTFGMGAGASGFWLDYALLLGGASGDGQHRVGLTFRPGAMNMGGAGGASPPAARPAKMAKAKSAKKAAPKAEPAKSDEVLALDTAPPREAPMKETPRSMPAAAKRAQTAKPAAAPAPAPETRKPIPVVAIPPAPRLTTAATRAADSTKSAAPKTAVAAIEAPKPAAPATEAPKSGENAPADSSVKAAPAETPAAVQTPAPHQVRRSEPEVKAEPAKPAVPRPTHVTVRKGQTLDIIAAQWGTTAAAIMMENNLITTKPPKPGTKLKLPPVRR